MLLFPVILQASTVGYCNDLKSYKLFHPSTHKLIASRDVVFHEHTDASNKTEQGHGLTNTNEYVKLNSIVQEQEVEEPQEK